MSRNLSPLVEIGYFSRFVRNFPLFKIRSRGNILLTGTPVSYAKLLAQDRPYKMAFQPDGKRSGDPLTFIQYSFQRKHSLFKFWFFCNITAFCYLPIVLKIFEFLHDLIQDVVNEFQFCSDWVLFPFSSKISIGVLFGFHLGFIRVLFGFILISFGFNLGYIWVSFRFQLGSI